MSQGGDGSEDSAADDDLRYDNKRSNGNPDNSHHRRVRRLVALATVPVIALLLLDGVLGGKLSSLSVHRGHDGGGEHSVDILHDSHALSRCLDAIIMKFKLSFNKKKKKEEESKEPRRDADLDTQLSSSQDGDAGTNSGRRVVGPSRDPPPRGIERRHSTRHPQDRTTLDGRPVDQLVKMPSILPESYQGRNSLFLFSNVAGVPSYFEVGLSTQENYGIENEGECFGPFKEIRRSLDFDYHGEFCFAQWVLCVLGGGAGVISPSRCILTRLSRGSLLAKVICWLKHKCNAHGINQ